MPASWVVVLTTPSHEEFAQRDLHKVGYRTWLPRYRKLTTRFAGGERRPMPVFEPLLPGAIFVQDWRGWPRTPISGTIGIMPGRLADEDIAVVTLRERAGAFDEPDGSRVMEILDQLTSAGRGLIEALLGVD